MLTREHFCDELAFTERPRPEHDGVVDPFHQAS
jgi:hypothetical protein